MARPLPPHPSDGSEAALVSVKNAVGSEAALTELRRVLKGKLIACPDCRSLRDAVVMLLDLALNTPPEPETPAVETSLETPNSTVRIVPPTPSPSGIGQGQEVAPGVVMIPPTEPK